MVRSLSVRSQREDDITASYIYSPQAAAPRTAQAFLAMQPDLSSHQSDHAPVGTSSQAVRSTVATTPVRTMQDVLDINEPYIEVSTLYTYRCSLKVFAAWLGRTYSGTTFEQFLAMPEMHRAAIWKSFCDWPEARGYPRQVSAALRRAGVSGIGQSSQAAQSTAATTPVTTMEDVLELNRPHVGHSTLSGYTFGLKAFAAWLGRTYLGTTFEQFLGMQELQRAAIWESFCGSPEGASYRSHVSAALGRAGVSGIARPRWRRTRYRGQLLRDI